MTTHAPSTSLSAFLLACLADDEAVALAASPGPWSAMSNGLHPHPGEMWNVGPSGWRKGDGWPLKAGLPNAAHIAANDPARVLANVAALRAVIGMHHVGDPDEWSPEQWACRLCQWDEDCDSPKHDHQHGAGRFPCNTLRALAQPFAGRDGWQEAWGE